MASITVIGDSQQALQLLKLIDRRDHGFIWDNETVSPDLLQRLTLSSSRITSLVPMYNCSFRGLSQLNLSFNRISDISHLSHLQALRLLDISHNRIVSLEALRKMSKLAVLRCHNNAIEVLEPLMGMALLQELWISDNKIDWLEFIYLLPLVSLYHLVKMNNPSDSKAKLDSLVWGLCASLATLDGRESSNVHEAALAFFSTVDGKVMFAQAKSQLTPAMRNLLKPYVDRINVYTESGGGAKMAVDSSSSASPESTWHAKHHRHASPSPLRRTHDDSAITTVRSRSPSPSRRHAGGEIAGSSPPRRVRVQHFKAKRKMILRKYVPNASPIDVSHLQPIPVRKSNMPPPQQQQQQQAYVRQASPTQASSGSEPLSPEGTLTSYGSGRGSGGGVLKQVSTSSPGNLNMAGARRLFNQLDRHGNNAITLRDLVLAARDHGSEASQLLHDMLQLPAAVHQEGDGSKDAIVRLFTALHGPNGEMKQGVSFEEWVEYMDSHHFLSTLESVRAGQAPPAGESPHVQQQVLLAISDDGGEMVPSSSALSAASMALVPASNKSSSSKSSQGPLTAAATSAKPSLVLSPPQRQQQQQQQQSSTNQLQPMYSQIYRFGGGGEDEPVALCLQDGGDGYARWSKGGPVACSFESGRIFSSYRGGGIAVVFDRDGVNGSVMDNRGKTVLLVNEGGARIMEAKTGRVLSEEKRGGAGEVHKWAFDGLAIEFLPSTWEIKVRLQNDRVACEFSSLSGGRVVLDRKVHKDQKALRANAARLVEVDLDENFDHAGIASVSSGLDSIMTGLVAAGGRKSKIPVARRKPGKK